MVAANDIFRDTSFMGGLGNFEFSEQYLGLTAGLNEANPVGDTTSDPQLLSDLASTANTPTVEHEAARLGLACVAIPVMIRGRSAAVPAYVGERVDHDRGISDRVTDIAHGARPDGISQCQCNVSQERLAERGADPRDRPTVGDFTASAIQSKVRIRSAGLGNEAEPGDQFVESAASGEENAIGLTRVATAPS